MEGDQAQLVRLTPRRAAAAAVVLVAAGLAVAFLWPHPRKRPSSVFVTDASVRISSSGPRSYRITYAQTGGGNASTIELTVRRPFDERVVTRRRDGSITDDTWTLGRYSTNDQVIAWAPEAARGDRRPDATLAEAVRKHYARARETRRIAGRLCRVYRVATAVDSLPLATVPAHPHGYRDICFDRDGLTLQESMYDDSGLVRRVIATDVAIDPAIDDSMFDIGGALEPSAEGGSLQKLEPTSKLPGPRFFELRHRPKGFTRLGRFAVVPPGQPGLNQAESHTPVTAYMSEVWQDGVDALVIDQGGPTSGRPFVPDTASVKIHAGVLGAGEARYGLLDNEVRFAVGGSRFVRLHGTLPMHRLLEIARDMREVPGGPLRVAKPTG